MSVDRNKFIINILNETYDLKILSPINEELAYNFAESEFNKLLAFNS